MTNFPTSILLYAHVYILNDPPPFPQFVHKKTRTSWIELKPPVTNGNYLEEAGTT